MHVTTKIQHKQPLLLLLLLGLDVCVCVGGGGGLGKMKMRHFFVATQCGRSDNLLTNG